MLAYSSFPPVDLCPTDKRLFMKWRESEVKHGRIAMLAVLGVIVGEGGFGFLKEVSGPAIYQFQQADSLIPAFTANVIGLTLAVEGFNIVKGWESPKETEAAGDYLAALKPTQTPGDVRFDPIGLKPKNAKDLKAMQTKEINNGRLAMLGIAGIVAQELVTNSPIF